MIVYRIILLIVIVVIGTIAEFYLRYMYGNDFAKPDKEYDSCCGNYLKMS